MGPISPYIFIPCMEFLRQLIERKCLEGAWIPMKASSGNMGISHLFFAVDLILFAKVNARCVTLFQMYFKYSVLRQD